MQGTMGLWSNFFPIAFLREIYLVGKLVHWRYQSGGIILSLTWQNSVYRWVTENIILICSTLVD